MLIGGVNNAREQAFNVRILPPAQSSANERPASCCSFQDCVHTVARNSSIASVSPSKSLRYKYRGFQSIRTPPRSNTAMEHSAMRRKILTGRTTPVEVQYSASVPFSGSVSRREDADNDHAYPGTQCVKRASLRPRVKRSNGFGYDPDSGLQ